MSSQKAPVSPVIEFIKVLNEMSARYGRKDVYCTDILVQAAAARSALNGFTRELIDQHLSTCVAEDLKNGGEEKLQEFLWILNKLV